MIQHKNKNVFSAAILLQISWLLGIGRIDSLILHLQLAVFYRGIIMIRKILLLIFLIHQVIYAHVFHYIPQKEELLTNEFVWTQEYCDPFDEILLAWNAERPSTGAYIIEISLFTDTWSPWFPYAYWSKDNQHVHNLEFFKQAGVFLHTQKATGFKIRVSAQEKTSFDKFYALHASL